MHLDAVRPVFVGARARAAAEGLHVQVVATIRSGAGKGRDPVCAIAGGDHALGHGFGERAKDHIDHSLTGLRARCRGRRERSMDHTGRRRDDMYRIEHAVVGRAFGVDQHLERVQRRGLQASEAVVHVATHLRRGAGEVEPYLVALDADRHLDGNIGGAHTVVVEHVGELVGAVGQAPDAGAHAACDRVDDGLAAAFDLIGAPAPEQFLQAAQPEAVAGDLRVVVAAPLMRHAHVEQDQLQDVVDDLAAGYDPDRRNTQAFLVDLGHAASHTARCHAAYVRMVRDVGDEKNKLAVAEHWRKDRHVGQVRAAPDKRIVGDEHVAGANTVAAEAFEHDFDQAQHGGQVQRQALALHHDTAGGIEDRRAVVVAFLDVGRVGAFHDRGVHLVADAG